MQNVINSFLKNTFDHHQYNWDVKVKHANGSTSMIHSLLCWHKDGHSEIILIQDMGKDGFVVFVEPSYQNNVVKIRDAIIQLHHMKKDKKI